VVLEEAKRQPYPPGNWTASRMWESGMAVLEGFSKQFLEVYGVLCREGPRRLVSGV
jgi:hypothetical protein